jgi:hypothetical protein
MTPSADHPKGERVPSEALTSIHSMYTLAATNEAVGSEVEDLMVKHFIETLSEIAMAIASRRSRKQEPEH